MNVSINPTKAQEILGTASATHVLTTVNDKIINANAADWPGGIPNKVINEAALYDLALARQKSELLLAGKLEEAAKIEPTMPYGFDLAEDAKRQQDRIETDGGFTPYDHVIKPIGRAGNTIDTPYETARQFKYLKEVSGKIWKLKIFQAKNVVKTISTTDLNMVGFIRVGELLTGQPELGDEQEPIPSRQLFSKYEKPIYADAFHWHSSMRERSDSGPNIETEMTKLLPGIMEKMPNDKIIADINAVAVSGANLTNWFATNADGHYAAKASLDIDSIAHAIDEFESELCLIAPRSVIQAYKLNVQGRNYTATQGTLSEDDRTGSLPLNEHVNYYIDNHMDAGKLALVAKEHAIEMFQGPQLDILYKNDKTPGQLIGRMKFNYNGIITKMTDAIEVKAGAVA